MIIPIPKNPHPSENNDYRPVALTSIVVKCFENYIVSLLKSKVTSKLDSWQFAYRQGRSADDAVGSVTQLVSKHLEDSKACARLLLILVRLNTLQPYLLLEKLKQMDVNPYIIKWYFFFNR